MKFIFIHGGPGLNSNPEKKLLTKHFQDMGHEFVVWHAPSEQRPLGDAFSMENSFQNMCNSLVKFIKKESQQFQVSVIAHSFGAFLLNRVLHEVSGSIERNILIAPVVSLFDLDRNIFQMAAKDYDMSGEANKANEIKEASDKCSSSFNEERLKSLLLSFENPNVLPNYWLNKSVAGIYSSYFGETGYEVDFNEFRYTRESIRVEKSEYITEAPTLILYGKHDPVVVYEKEKERIKTLYPNSNILVFENSGHYPHIEEQDSFLAFVNGVDSITLFPMQ